MRVPIQPTVSYDRIKFAKEISNIRVRKNLIRFVFSSPVSIQCAVKETRNQKKKNSIFGVNRFMLGWQFLLTSTALLTAFSAAGKIV